MPKAFEVVYLDPQRVTFERKGDTLSLTLQTDAAPDGAADGTTNIIHYPRVALRACFPVSDSTEFLSVRDATDEALPELGIIEDWSQLQSDSRAAVAAELGLHYFVPEITQVFEIKEELGFLYWTVQTDKGRKEFVMRNSVIHYAREVAPGHWLLIDVNEARYEIPDVAALDAHSQKLIQQFLYL
ncbi:MAG TPA: DUF1854 domain-containing protein [Anaerolineae bacterium]|nr:DUF1854 domain-containing protein [Anaerolineae bacterium]HQI87537.1 DUF1854 domain-containing protein [Anaerolineae bacterium]